MSCLRDRNGFLYDTDEELRNYPSNKRLNGVYNSMKSRCNNPNNKAYKHYGGRGIKVCELWEQKYFGRLWFINWAYKHGYQEGLTIDRIDNDGNYCPENCRWVDRTTQANNKRNNVFVEINGKRLTVSQWAKKTHRTREQMLKVLKETFGNDVFDNGRIVCQLKETKGNEF